MDRAEVGGLCPNGVSRMAALRQSACASRSTIQAAIFRPYSVGLFFILSFRFSPTIAWALSVPLSADQKRFNGWAIRPCRRPHTKNPADFARPRINICAAFGDYLFLFNNQLIVVQNRGILPNEHRGRTGGKGQTGRDLPSSIDDGSDR
jgi:hypothetical protein